MEAVRNEKKAAAHVDAQAGSLLVDRQIRELCSGPNPLVSNYSESSVESISYNLTIAEIFTWKLGRKTGISADAKPTHIEFKRASPMWLAPGEMAFVRMKERLQMPDNLVGRIVERNSLMRLGLLVSGPQYQPGHNTAIFLRVYNLSSHDIELKVGNSIAQICFEVLDQVPEISYGADKHDQYQGEDAFQIPLDYIEEHVSDSPDLQKQMDNLEARIYTVVAAFIGAFVSVLSLLVLNFSALEGKSVREIVAINLSVAFCIAILLGMVFFFCASLTEPPRPRRHYRSHSSHYEKDSPKNESMR